MVGLRKAHEIMTSIQAHVEPAEISDSCEASKSPKSSFSRQSLLFLLVSAAVLGPLFWQPVIQAGDLPSHLYNAWLSLLIREGRAPGLWIARQWTNEAFDVMLTWLFRMFGAIAAERIALSVSVLTFFWGAFAFVCAVSKRRAWFLTPCLAVLAYGWVFQSGLLNFYFSAGLAFFFFGIAWSGRMRNAMFASPLLALAFTAHPLPLLWLVAVMAYVYIARNFSRSLQAALLLASLGVVFLLRQFFESHFSVHWSAQQLLWITGADQAVVFGQRYWIIAAAILVSWGLVLLHDSDWPRIVRESPSQLLAINAAAIFLLPNLVSFSHGTRFVSLIPQRMSLFSGVLACAVAGRVRPRKRFAVIFACVAALYFCFLYQDAYAVRKIETKIDSLVGQLPPMSRIFLSPRPQLHRGSRLDATLAGLPLLWRAGGLPGVRVSLAHVADRACIARCFDFGNYEASTTTFRVRALPGNTIVAWNYPDTESIEEGTWAPRKTSRPIFQIYQCGLAADDLCIRPWMEDQ